MKIAVTAARYLLGFVFTLFGLNGFLHFIPQPPLPEPLAIQYMTVLMATNYFVLVFLVQLIAGLFLLANRFVPLALASLAPVIVNILLFHVLMNPEGIGPGLLVTVLWIVLFLHYRQAFAPLFQAKPLEHAVGSQRPDLQAI